MQLSTVILRVRDLDSSLQFYRDIVGLDVSSTAPGFAFLATGTVAVALNQNPAEARDDTSSELVLEVDDVVAAHEAMTGRGVPFEVEPRPVMSQDGRTLLAAHFRDPDGHLWSVTGWV